MPTLGQWRYSCDREATAAAYALATTSYSQSCSCSGCRNFIVARAKVFPESFLALLESLGINPAKDGEIYHTCRMSPGKHLYGGWFHFVGTLDETGDFAPIRYSDNFEITLCRNCAPCLPTLKNLPLVQLEIVATAVPWCLDEEEAT